LLIRRKKNRCLTIIAARILHQSTKIIRDLNGCAISYCAASSVCRYNINPIQSKVHIEYFNSATSCG
jgi:hypothetical protein